MTGGRIVEKWVNVLRAPVLTKYYKERGFASGFLYRNFCAKAPVLKAEESTRRVHPVHLRTLIAAAPALAAALTGGTMSAQTDEPVSVYDFTVNSIEGKPVQLSEYKGKVLLIVNVASKCGYTPQYKGLEALYEKYRERGFVVLGFPANNFRRQEPGTDEEIKSFCTTNYGVTFDMFSKISVKGEDQHPLYAFLTSGRTDPAYAGEVRWNFQKYLIDRKGKIIGRYYSAVDPLSSELTGAIEAALK
jgi:glutathione peroxidase